MGRKFESYNRVPVKDEVENTESEYEVENAEPESFNRIFDKDEVENVEPESFNRVPVKDEVEETEFKPFDKVLARNDEGLTWLPEIYSYYNKDVECHHRVVGGMLYKYCIPYEGNEHLAGTSINLKPKRWRAKVNENYWFIDLMLSPIEATEKHKSFDDDMYELCNYFQTRQEAVAMAEQLKKILKQKNDD